MQHSTHRRALSLLRLTTSQILLLVLIGQLYYETSISSSDTALGLAGYGLNDILLGLTSFMLVQAFSLPLAFVHLSFVTTKKVVICLIVICILALSASIIYALEIILTRNHQFYLYWTFTYAVAGLLDMVGAQLIYAVLWRSCKVRGRESPRKFSARMEIEEPLITARLGSIPMRKGFTPSNATAIVYEFPDKLLGKALSPNHYLHKEHALTSTSSVSNSGHFKFH